MAQSYVRTGWIVVAAGTGINLVLGFLYSWSVIKKVLVTQMHWSNFDASLPFTVAALGLAGMMIFAGRLQDVFGPRISATIGGALFGLGIILSAWVNSPLGMVLTYGVMGGIGLGFCYAAATPAAVKWFPPAKRGLITGIVVSGVGMASVYTAPLTNWLLKLHGLSNTFLYLGIAAFILMVGFAQFLKNPPTESAPKPAGQAASVPPSESAWKQTIQTPSFYKLWLMYGFSASAGMMMISHLATIAKTQAQWENGFYLVALLAMFNTIGRIAAGHWSDSFGYTRTMLVVFCVQALNMLLFANYVTPTLLAVGTAFTGLSYGALFSLFPAATADYFGVKNLGVNYGMVFTAWGLAGVIGPLVAGWVVDTTGSYHYSYLFCAGLLVLAAGLSFFTAHPSKNTAAKGVAATE